MGCGGACGGNCACSTRKPGDSRRFGIRAMDEVVLKAVRELQLEDPAGIAVVLTEDEYRRLVDGSAKLRSPCQCGCP